MKHILTLFFLLVCLVSVSQDIRVDEMSAQFLGRKFSDMPSGLQRSKDKTQPSNTYHDNSSIYSFNKQMELYSVTYVAEGWLGTAPAKEFYETVFNLYTEILINLGQPYMREEQKDGAMLFVWRGITTEIKAIVNPSSFIIGLQFYSFSLSKN